jgi:hypothetical protein
MITRDLERNSDRDPRMRMDAEGVFVRIILLFCILSERKHTHDLLPGYGNKKGRNSF